LYNVKRGGFVVPGKLNNFVDNFGDNLLTGIDKSLIIRR
jgi:hypothetical protein